MIYRFLFLLVGIFSIIYIIYKVRKYNLSEEKSILWIIAGLAILVLSIWPNLIIKLSNLVGIDYGPSTLFLVAIVFIIFIIFRQDNEISEMNEKIKELSQQNAILKIMIKAKHLDE